MVNIIFKSMFLIVFLFGVLFLSLIVHEGTHFYQYRDIEGKSICYNFAQDGWMSFNGEDTEEKISVLFESKSEYNEKVALIIQLVFALSLVFGGGYFIGKWKRN